jgi:hypothetical protein
VSGPDRDDLARDAIALMVAAAENDNDGMLAIIKGTPNLGWLCVAVVQRAVLSMQVLINPTPATTEGTAPDVAALMRSNLTEATP